ncbi:MAG TPA: twin-arginine translocation signal domain-containing protein, partial [Blastocatellia bacterium]|nr:twin-arginine translocation signal domain-containing protein [Blastocatellia bacterium]
MPKKEKKHPEEQHPGEHGDFKSKSKISRRKVLKMGAAAGAVTILSPTILTSRKSTVYAQTTVTEPVLCAPTPLPVSPATTPFLDNLPIPFPAIP